jgi:hypothetical protein
MMSIGFSFVSSLPFRFFDFVVVDRIIGSAISNGNFFLPRDGVARIFVGGGGGI